MVPLVSGDLGGSLLKNAMKPGSRESDHLISLKASKKDTSTVPVSSSFSLPYIKDMSVDRGARWK